MSTEENEAAKNTQLEGLLAVQKRSLSTAEEALGVIANAVGKALKVPTSEFRSAKRGAELAALVVQALDRAAQIENLAKRSSADGDKPAPRVDVDALAAASIESFKARIEALEARLLEAGIDPITVRGEEPEGFRDNDASAGGATVAGAADDLAAAFASSNEIEPDRS